MKFAFSWVVREDTAAPSREGQKCCPGKDKNVSETFLRDVAPSSTQLHIQTATRVTTTTGTPTSTSADQASKLCQDQAVTPLLKSCQQLPTAWTPRSKPSTLHASTGPAMPGPPCVPPSPDMRPALAPPQEPHPPNDVPHSHPCTNLTPPTMARQSWVSSSANQRGTPTAPEPTPLGGPISRGTKAPGQCQTQPNLQHRSPCPSVTLHSLCLFT